MSSSGLSDASDGAGGRVAPIDPPQVGTDKEYGIGERRPRSEEIGGSFRTAIELASVEAYNRIHSTNSQAVTTKLAQINKYKITFYVLLCCLLYLL